MPFVLVPRLLLRLCRSQHPPGRNSVTVSLVVTSLSRSPGWPGSARHEPGLSSLGVLGRSSCTES
eukprot:71802-Hanusia_phi.AAC.1